MKTTSMIWTFYRILCKMKFQKEMLVFLVMFGAFATGDSIYCPKCDDYQIQYVRSFVEKRCDSMCDADEASGKFFGAGTQDTVCGEMVSVQDFHDHAKRVLDSKAIHYIDLGAAYMTTLENNLQAFKNIRIRPRVMRNVSRRILSTHLLGHKVSFPVGVSPAASQMVAHPRGENATAIACASAGTLMIVGAYSTVPLEQVASASNGGLRWQQMHIFPDKNLTLDLVRRAEAVDSKAIVVTVDFSLTGIRYQSRKDKYLFPGGARWANFDRYGYSPMPDPSTTWEEFLWLKNQTLLPIVVKGILTAEDALLAVEYGASGIIVSNHGGRQLDGASASIEALPEIVRAVSGRAEVYLDSGVRSGMDVFKALALGAKAIFVGRPLLWGLTFQGETGGKCVLDILKNELDNTMGLTGHSNVSDIPRTAVKLPNQMTLAPQR